MSRIRPSGQPIVRSVAWLQQHASQVLRVLLAVLAALVLVDFLIPAHYHRLPWEGLNGAGALFGLGLAALLAAAAVVLGALLGRREEAGDDD